MRRRIWLVLVVCALAAMAAGGLLFRRSLRTLPRDRRVIDWIRDPSEHTAWSLPAGTRCPGVPFQLPTSGFIGYLWDDSFRPGHRHSGVDIFGGTQPGVVSVFATADGYLTRLAEWKSSLILRIPSDPLQPDRQIWAYYTHMAGPSGDSLIEAAFPAGTSEVKVAAGTLLGYQGNFSGTPGVPVGVHLHFSIVRDDGKGKFLDERNISNTLDPSPYLGMALNANLATGELPGCRTAIP
jgi:hypothetical protein